MDDSFLFDWLKTNEARAEGSDERTKEDKEQQPILDEGKAGPILSKVTPQDFENIFKDDSELSEGEKVAKDSIKDYLMLIHLMRSAAKSSHPSSLIMIALDTAQVKQVTEATVAKYGPTNEIAMSVTAQMLMASMMATLIGHKYNVPNP